jgi:hypothetical protein
MFVYMLCAGAALTGLGLLMATWFSRLGRAVGVTVAVYVLVTVGWIFLIRSLNKGPENNELSMASPFFWAGKMTSDFGRRQFTGATDWAIFWTGLALLLAILMLDCAIRDFDRFLGRTEDSLARLSRPTRRARIDGRIFFAAAVVCLPLALSWYHDGAFVIALEFALGSVVVAAMAASPPEPGLPRGVEDLAGFRLSPKQIVIAKWSGTFRFALMFISLPLFMIFTGIRVHSARWQELLLATAYMLAVSAAATSVGVVIFVWFGRSRQAVLVAVLTWGLAIIPWSALPYVVPGGALRDALWLSSPILAMETLSRACVGGPSASALEASAGIAVSIAIALGLLRVGQARCKRINERKDSAMLFPSRAVPQLTTDN